MKQISKSLSEQIARKLTEKNQKTVSDFEQETRNLCINKYNESLSAELVSKLKDIPEQFIVKNNCIRIKREGFYEMYVYVKDDLYGQRPVINDEQFYELFKQRQEKLGQMESKLNTLRNQISETIFKLRTPQRIEKEFPEAFKLLPVEQASNLPALNTKELLNSIETFPE